jgi:hypothetical protein
MAANHAELLEALKESAHRVSVEATQQWMLARNNHPLYAELTETRTTPRDQELLTQIHRDIQPLREYVIETLAARTLAWDDYYDFI